MSQAEWAALELRFVKDFIKWVLRSLQDADPRVTLKNGLMNKKLLVLRFMHLLEMLVLGSQLWKLSQKQKPITVQLMCW